MSHTDPYPAYTRPERIADGAVHVTGLVFSVLGSILLITMATGRADGATLTGLAIYAAAMTASFAASACYHFTPWEGPRPLLRRLDHAAIYLKIAGTYTPLVILIGSAFAYSVLAIVWGLAAIGAAMKLFFWARPGRMGVVLYLGLGWLSVALVTSLFPLLPTGALALILLGGLIYSAGAVLFSLEGMRFQNAVWHGFVLAASVCFFAAIAMGVLPSA